MSRRRVKEPTKILVGLQAPNEVLQFLALLLADDVVAERVKLHRDFFLGHRIAFWNVDAGEWEAPLCVVIVTRLDWNFGKSDSNSWFATTFTLSRA